MTLPPWTDWKSWSAIVGAIGALVGIIVALPNAAATVEPFFYVSSGYLKDATQPLLVAALQNTVAIIETKQEAIRVRMDMAGARLRVTPDDAVVQAAWAAAVNDWEAAAFEKTETLCRLRFVQGLGCAR